MVPDLIDLPGPLTQHLGVLVFDAQLQGLGAIHLLCFCTVSANGASWLWSPSLCPLARAALSFPAQIRRLWLQAAAQPTDLGEACRAFGHSSPLLLRITKRQSMSFGNFRLRRTSVFTCGQLSNDVPCRLSMIC